MLEDVLAQGLRAFGLTGDTSPFRVYYDALTAANETANLTAISGEDETASLHFLDSLALLTLPPMSETPNGSTIIDVGTGAGFPGLPLKIVRPDIKLTLLDAREKRVAFLKDVAAQLKLDVECVHARAEEYAAHKRESFDFAVSRAVANLRELAELSLPLVRTGGYFVAMKSQNSDAEIAEAANAFKVLGGGTPEIFDYALPDGTPRRLVVVKKKTATPLIYPRRYSKITAVPL